MEGHPMNTTPIEFMAWDTRHNKLFNVEALHKDQVDYVDDGETLFDRFMPKYGYPSREEVYLMQLTALRSINNEPIYNHMIVKDEYGEHHLVDMFNYTKMFYISLEKLEIVGNRFQSPHLLEMCK